MTRANDILSVLNEQRRMLQMPLSVLSTRAGTSVSTVMRVLAGHEVASFTTVARIADTLGVELRYTRPRGVATIRRAEARAAAKRIVGAVQGTSALEGQAVSRERLKLMEQETEAELLASG